MPRYKLRVPGEGDILYGDGIAVVAAEKEDARGYLEDYTGEPVPYLHSSIGSCRVVYKRDVDGGDCHDDAEPGDTTVDYRPDDGSELRSYECRVWELGAPSLARWKMEPIREPVNPTDIPTGTRAFHRRIGSGATAGPAVAIGGWWYIPIQFEGWDENRRTWVPTKRLNCKVACVGVLPGMSWPKPKYRLTINGEHVADGTEARLRDLLDIREARLRAEWEAAEDREREVVV